VSYRHHQVANNVTPPKPGGARRGVNVGVRVAVKVQARRESTRVEKTIHLLICLAALVAFGALLAHLAIPAGEPLHLSSKG
jgi:hypothetical protein